MDGLFIMLFLIFIGAGSRKAYSDQERIDAGYYTIYLGKKYAHYRDEPRNNPTSRICHL